MKEILLFIVLCTILGVSGAHSMQAKPSGQEHPLKIESQLIQDKYQLFAVITGGKPIAEHSYLLAKAGDTQLEIRDTKDFAQIVKGISSKEEALELVRLITSQEIRPFLRDIYYAEVHKQVEPQKEGEEKDRWFAIEPTQYDEWKLHEPVVTDENGSYKIERFVACYPRILPQKELSQARLVKIWEWVDSDGNYLAEIQDVIAEGDTIHKILIFTK
jgi:hypothetical protein